jgi:hypothetical protein
MSRPGPPADINDTPFPSAEVTQREKTEALRWRSVFDNSAIGVALADANGRVLGNARLLGE